MEVFHPIMMRSYMRKFDMDEPPMLEPLEDVDMKKVKENSSEEGLLTEKYYR